MKSVLDERESKAEKPSQIVMSFNVAGYLVRPLISLIGKLSCHLTGAPENKWVKDENKQVFWKRA